MAPPLPWHAEWRVGGVGVVVRPSLVVNSGDSLRAAAIAGLGLTPAPDWLVADALSAGRLARVLSDFETPSSGNPTNRAQEDVRREIVPPALLGLGVHRLPRTA